MSLSPSNILDRLKELKLWQQSHEELLNKTKNLINTSTNATDISDYQTIEGLSAFDSTTDDESTPQKMKNTESIIISPTKSFNELLEEKLAEDIGPDQVKVVNKPKKPFLRKGSGLERFRMKNRPKLPQTKQATCKMKKTSKEDGITPLKMPDVSVKPRATWTKVDDSGEGIHKINEEVEINKYCGKLQLSCRPETEPGEQTLYERALEKELLIFEALEQKANNSSFCSTNSSVLQILSSTPTKIIKPPHVEEKRVHWESLAEDDDVIESNLEISEILQRLRKIAEKKNEIPVIPEVSEDEKWSTTDASSEETSISSADLEITLRTEKRDMGVGTDEELTSGCTICGHKIEKQIAEYESKLGGVIQDKNKITQIKKKLEQDQRDLLKKQKQFEDEKRDALYDLEIEKKKLMKEKQVFQTLMKDSQNRPNKKERMEISNLKQEVADLTETLKLKDSKNGMTQARLRNQIKQIEKENLNLKDEVERLTKENAKLSATQKLNRRPSDAKILQEINKNITKLTQETIKTKKEELENEEEKNRQKYSKKVHNDSKNDSLLEMTVQGRGSNIEMQCETQTTTERPQSISLEHPSPQLNCSTNRRQEHILDNGSKQINYPNGNVKIVSPDGNLITVQYYNGDVKETNQLIGTVKYFFHSEQIWQTTFKDGVELIEFPTGIKEKRYLDGKCEVFLPNNVLQTTFSDGTQETKYPDGSRVQITTNGEKILFLSNGQKEIETKEYKRREYPDGTMKILYADGTQETRYTNGRIRIKDINGTLIVDTHS